MTASSWDQCPQCKANTAFKLAEQQAEVTAAYGKVTVDEFDRRRDDFQKAVAAANKAEPTFREDYEFIGAADGEIIATYKGSCTKCKLNTKFTHVHKFF